MSSKTWCLFLFVSLLITYSVCDSSGKSGGSDSSDSANSKSKPEGKSIENKKEKGEEVTECNEPEGSPECNCQLTDGLENSGNKITDPTQKTTWINWITTIKTTILVQSTLTISQKFVQISESIEEFKISNAAIFSIVEFETIKSYGKNLFVISDIENLAISFMDETASSAISLDGNDKCNLFDAFLVAATGDATFTSKVTTLNSELTVILKNTAITYEEQMTQIFTKIDTFTTTNPTYKDKIEKADIKNFFKVKGFKKVAKKYKQSTTKTKVISGDVNQVVLIKKLKEKFTDTSVPADMQAQIKLLHDITKDFFETETNVEKRTKKFSFFYYHFTKSTVGLQKHLDKIELDASFGSLGELIMVSAMEYDTVDTSTMDTLITGSWNQTILIQSIYETYTDWNKTYNFHNLGWGTTQFALFRNAYINNNISLIISDTAMSMKKKHKKIVEVFQVYIDGYTVDTWFFCIPLGDWGFMADYKKAGKSASHKQWKCPIPWDCVAPRQKVIEIKPDNSTDFCTAFEEKIATYNGTTKTQVESYYQQMKTVIYQDTTFKKKPHKVSEIVKIIKQLKTAVTTVSTDIDEITFGSWGRGKKFCDCQDTANVADFK